MNTAQLGRALGWFSIGIGLAELLAPRRVGPAIGVGKRDKMLRSMGAREITSGLGLLATKRHHQTPWLWSRVLGDVLDLALLGSALTAGKRRDQRRIITAAAAVAGVTALDVYASIQSSRESQNGEGKGEAGKVVRKSIVISRPAEELYRFWRNLENLPQFMTHLTSVHVMDDKRSHWVAKGPMNSEMEWDAEIVEDRANELISWRSLPGSDVETSGSVEFESATGGRGTVVRVELRYNPPGGVIGATVAKLFGEAPEKQVPVELVRFRQLMETGEISKTEGQPAGRSRSTSRKFDVA